MQVVLISWSADADERAEVLRRAGHAVELVAPGGPDDLRLLRDSPSAAFVVDLGRRPSEGRSIAIMLRRFRQTRLVPIVFVGGEPEKVAQVQALLPDARYAEWSRVRGAVREATRRPPSDPVVPGTMDAYAGASLPQKLGVRAGSVVILLGAPDGFERELGVAVRKSLRRPTDLVILFVRSRELLERRLPKAVRGVAEGGSLWIAWPKKASGVPSDLGQAEVRAIGLAAGLVDYKVASIDETWSGLRFARRKA